MTPGRPYLAPLAALAVLGGTYLLVPATPPEPLDVTAEAGIAYLRIGQPWLGYETLARVLAADPTHIAANHALGLEATAAGRHDEAVLRLSVAHARAPHDDELAFALGVAYHKAERLAEAERVYRDLRRRRPNDARVVHNLAEIVIARGARAEGRELLRTWLALSPDAEPERRRRVERRIKRLGRTPGARPAAKPSAAR